MRIKRPLLDVVAEVLVADPAASLAEVAAAAGIGRTTLHKHYATRDDLVTAVAHRAIDLWEQALDRTADDGLRQLTDALLPIGAQLAFLWRSPVLDHAGDITDRWTKTELRGLAVLQRAKADGVIAASVPDWWMLQTYYSLIYVGAESVRGGRLAPRDATDLVLVTMLNGIGAR